MLSTGSSRSTAGLLSDGVVVRISSMAKPCTAMATNHLTAEQLARGGPGPDDGEAILGEPSRESDAV
ncbi:hypothetical protein [Nocardia mangyaensis]|uniref:hypothetical protein n=1 Tax=Nocardia mangyaensis TaxID=2213200 RepID=UPI0012EB7082|nr:hypothetical protein [Nocardia mangyaensis]